MAGPQNKHLSICVPTLNSVRRKVYKQIDWNPEIGGALAGADLTGGHSCSGRRGPWDAGPWRPTGLGGPGRLNFGLQLQSLNQTLIQLGGLGSTVSSLSGGPGQSPLPSLS